MTIIQHGLYTLSDAYFDRFKNKYLPDNKQEKRPYYYAFTDKDGMIWLIPLSSQTESYRAKIIQDEAQHKKCLFYHIGKIAGIDRVFLIGNMFPITNKYIKKGFFISGIHYVVGNEQLIREVRTRATRYLSLVRDGKLRPNADIVGIKKALQEE